MFSIFSLQAFVQNLITANAERQIGLIKGQSMMHEFDEQVQRQVGEIETNRVSQILASGSGIMYHFRRLYRL